MFIKVKGILMNVENIQSITRVDNYITIQFKGFRHEIACKSKSEAKRLKLQIMGDLTDFMELAM